MQHIATETGANITLRGKGSGIQEGDALHIYISSAIPKAFAEAAKLAQNLLDTVKAEHDKQVRSLRQYAEYLVVCSFRNAVGSLIT